MTIKLYTIGHSIHTIEYFISLLKKYAITAICDVRSYPYSKHNPQFNRKNLKNDLKNNGIEYVFMGRELGARSENPNCYISGKVQYHSLVNEPLFQRGIDRLCQGMNSYSIALMCAEKDPITCHRMILVCREIRGITNQIYHILANGEIESNLDAENRLLKTLNIAPDMFRSMSECIEEAYDIQGQRIAYVKKEKQIAVG